MAFLAGFVTPQDYGAVGNGVADDTTAMQSAINAVNSAGGGVLFIPEGTYLCTPSGSPATALTMTGMTGVRLVGASARASIIKKNGTGVLLSMSGPSTDTTGATHTRYCGLEDLGFDGGAHTGLVLQTYYADNLFFRDLYITNNPDICLDTAEFWDSRFYNIACISNGSATANASTPNFLLRNSAAASGFGASTDNVNQIHFIGCRWEGFTTGAVWIEQGVSNSSNQNGIYFDECKMETSSVNGGPHLLVDNHAKFVRVNKLYCYSGGFSGGYSTAQDVIQMSGQNSSLIGVDIANGGSATIANGVTLNSTVATQNATIQNVQGIYGTAPTGAHINIGTSTGGFTVENCYSNTGTSFAGTTPNGAAANLIQTFTTVGSSTWTKPPGAVLVTVLCIAGGGGGGSGAVEASGTVASGGGGGGGGAFTLKQFPASMLASTESVTVGNGGGGGTAVNTNGTNGNNGTTGGNSSFKGNTFAVANAGTGGTGGTTGTASGGSGGGGTFGGGAGGAGSSSGAAGSAGTSTGMAAPGGGAGGGITTGAAASAGGAGGNVSSSGGNTGGTAGTSAGGAGGAGTSVAAGQPISGTAGGGGGSAVSGTAGTGGAGGTYGAGGGGGGAVINGGTSGAGGSGAQGIVVVITTTSN